MTIDLDEPDYVEVHDGVCVHADNDNVEGVQQPDVNHLEVWRLKIVE